MNTIILWVLMTTSMSHRPGVVIATRIPSEQACLTAASELKKRDKYENPICFPVEVRQ